MPIDTSSYYPEVNGPDNENRGDSLNGQRDSLFGPTKVEKPSGVESEEEAPLKEREESNLERFLKDSKEKEESPVSPPQQDKGMLKGIDIFCNIISWVLVPLLMPVFAILFIFKLSILDVVPEGMQTAFVFIIAGINLVAPMLLIYLLKLVGVVDDLGLNGQKERLIPYLITALCYGISAWFLASRGAPVWVSMFFCGGVAASLINLCINFRWKISAHAAAIAGVVALLIRLQRDVAVEPKLFLWLIITVGAAGLLGSARVWLGRHTVWQVLAGYCVGFCSVFFMMYIH